MVRQSLRLTRIVAVSVDVWTILMYRDDQKHYYDMASKLKVSFAFLQTMKIPGNCFSGTPLLHITNWI